MKTLTNRGILLGVGLFGASTLIGLKTEASAAPRRDNDVREERKDVKEAHKDVRRERKDVRQADTPRERAEAQRELRDAQSDLQRERRDLRNERQENRTPAYRAPVYQGQNRAPVYQNRPTFGGNGNQYGGRVYTGTVTNVRSNQSFDVNIGGNTFNVYTVSRVPLGLTEGDIVRVNGVQQYNNDIRNASVSIVRNR